MRKSLIINDLRARPRPGRKSLARNDLRLGDHEVALGVLGDQRVGLAGHLLRDHVRVLRGNVRLATLITPRVQLKLLLAGEFHE